MVLPITAVCDTAWNWTKVCSDASSTEMQCLRPLHHSGAQHVRPPPARHVSMVWLNHGIPVLPVESWCALKGAMKSIHSDQKGLLARHSPVCVFLAVCVCVFVRLCAVLVFLCNVCWYISLVCVLYLQKNCVIHLRLCVWKWLSVTCCLEHSRPQEVQFWIQILKY
jgi:hypothetical protein